MKIAAIRAVQGSRVFYTCSVSISQLVDEWFTRSEPASERAQRAPIPSHIKSIAAYISENQNEYILGSLTFAVSSELEFTSINEDGNLGFIEIDPDISVHSLDGQHRFRAILEVVSKSKTFKNQSVGILIYVESDLAKKKQMFSDMNSTPKKVPKGINISFDNRDPFGRAAKELVKIHPILKDKTEMLASRVIANSSNFYSLSSVQDTLKKLHVGSIGRVKNLHEYEDESIINIGKYFFDDLLESRKEYREAMQSNLRLQKFRTNTILFNSTTLRVIAGAHFLFQRDWGGDKNEFHSEFRRRLALIDFKVNSSIFVNSGFVDKNSTTPNARNQQVAAGTKALFDALRKK